MRSSSRSLRTALLRAASSAIAMALGTSAMAIAQQPKDALANAPQPTFATTPDAILARKHTHWAWQPLRTDAPPSEGHPVDAFVDQELARVDLQRSPLAPPHQQLRRVWFDLVGLPPPPDAVARFVADPSDAAWAREVDALLASPAHSERFARHWLDLVRYAETLGHEFDYPLPHAWRYRDYVIRAIDQDLPFDQFLREHLAGDLLPTPRRGPTGDNESVQATAAWWFGEQVHAPIDPKRHLADRIDNQLDVLGKAMLGLTVACARCHDHKFDAIGAADYYGLFGVLRSTGYVQAPLQPLDRDSAGYQAAVAAQKDLVGPWGMHAGGLWAENELFVAEWFAFVAMESIELRPEDRGIADVGGATRVYRQRRAATLARFSTVNDAFSHYAGPFCPDPTAERPRLLQLPGPWWNSGAAGTKREGVLQTPTFVIDQRYLHVRTAGEGARLVVHVDGFHLVRDPLYGSLRRAIDRAEPHWVTFDLGSFAGRHAVLQAIDQRTPDLADPQHEHDEYPANGWLAVQCAVLSPHQEPPPGGEGLALPTPTWDTPPPPVRAALAKLAALQDALPVSPTVPALVEQTGRDEAIHHRGNPNQPGDVAPRRFLAALSGTNPLPAGDGSGRLALADALLAADNPLPARVLANRLWHLLFGRGLVRSADNLGALGDPPSHHELLDWLARELIAHGWSQKHVLRTIVTSATYRQASLPRDEAEARDAENVRLHRQNVSPLEAEALRDALLATAGRLDPTRFGPSIELPLDAVPSQRGRPRTAGPLDGAGRRSIYLAMRRNFRAPLLAAFDQPQPFAPIAVRNRSNVPAQALALANDPFVHAMAAAFAERVLADGGDDDAVLARAYTIAFARPPRADERQRAVAFLRESTAMATTGSADAAARLAAWTDLVHALLQTSEFRFRR
ncbi:MAG: DUF1549 and DUF1553 domain-containing protein [Planctomycetota bacterium]|jgi:hypothetical protein